VIGFFSTIFGLFFSVKKLVNVYHLDFLWATVLDTLRGIHSK
jgi:hypothetical protein